MAEGSGVWISPDIFEADLRPPDWPDDPDIRRAVDWIHSFLEPGEWKRRRFAALHYFVNTRSEPSVAYAIFTPLYDGKDMKLVDEVPAH